MNNYHIYEKIGTGKHSVVYKGRKKKTISYYAIKSVDKTQKARVLQEVRTMHALDHRNILKFYAWYETTNHLWLILEFCVGGDLMSLLRQDVRLPESSVHDFARDLVTALQYLHSKEIIYCDLKPSNILLDENGRMKLGGFGLSRRLADINKKPLQALPQAMRGTPCYMAPELFSEGATHSTASDLWAIGCVLYECSMGRPPFLNSSFNQLVHEILNNEPQPIPGASPEYHDMIARLLDKNPATRIKWKELGEHPFWQVPLPTLSLPPEPALEAFIAQYGLAPTKEEIRQSTRDGLKLDKGRTMRQSVDITRLSRIALHNLEREGEGADYSSTAGAATAAESQPGDIRIDSADAELDFEENREEAADEENPASPAASDDGSVIDQGSVTTLSDGRVVSATPNDAMMVRAAAAAAHQGGHGALGASISTRRGGAGTPDGGGVGSSMAAAGGAGRPQTRGGDDMARSTSGAGASGRVAGTAVDVDAAATVASGSGAAMDDVMLVETGPLAADRDATSLDELIWHPSDTAVKPIVANRRIERLPEPRYDPGSLPFKPWSLKEMLGADQPDLEVFLTHIYRAIGSAAPLKDKVNVLSYFETLCVDTNAANVLINSSLTMLFIRMLRTARAPTLRIRLASVLGLLVRHATFITEELAGTGVVELLSEALKDKNERVRRRVIATLGELLFYIATQQQDTAAAGNEDGAAPPPDPAAVWGISSNTYTQVIRLLKDKEDEVAAHYAVKTVENICSQGGEWAARFTTQDVVLSLVQIINGPGRGEQLRATAASTLARLLRHSPTLTAQTVDKYGIRLFVGCLLEGASSSPASSGAANGAGATAGTSGASSKVQTAALNLLNLTLAQPDLSTRARASLAEERGLLPGLVNLMDHSLPLIRAKAVVTIMLLSRLSPRWLLEACKAKLIPAIERLAREKDEYLTNALTALRAEAARVVTAIAAAISEELGGRGGTSGGARRSPAVPAGGAGGARPQPSKSPLALFPVLLHLITSPHFRSAVVSGQLVADLASWLTITAGPAAIGTMSGSAAPGVASSSGSAGANLMADFKSTLMHVLEAFCQQGELVLQHYTAVLNSLLPALCGVVSAEGEGGDTRFFCLRMVSDVLQTLLLDEELYGSAQQRAEGGGGVAAAAIDRVLRSHILPLVPRLLRDEDPMPLYALKLLGGLLEINLFYVADVEAMGLAAQFFEFLSLEHSNNNVHNIRLCRQIIAAGSMPVAKLVELQVAEKVAAVLEYASNHVVEPFLEPVLELVNTILQRDALEVSQGRSNGSLAAVFLEQAGVLLDNCAHPDLPVCSSAASATSSLVALFPEQCAPWLLAPENASALATVLAGQHLQQQPGGAGGQQGAVAVPSALLQPLLEAVALALEMGGAASPSEELVQLYNVVQHVADSSQDVSVRTISAEVARTLETLLH